jgi:uncharacterized membrane protein (UPF0127 family)
VLSLLLAAAFGPRGARLRALFRRARRRAGEGFRLERAPRFCAIGHLVPADLIYLDARNRVVELVEHAGWRLIPRKEKAACVLELPAHTIFCSQTALGDQLLFAASEETEMQCNQEAS